MNATKTANTPQFSTKRSVSPMSLEDKFARLLTIEALAQPTRPAKPIDQIRMRFSRPW